MNPFAQLSKSEATVVEWVAWGADAKTIAEKRFVSIFTVRNQVRTAMEKIGVTKATELSAWWFCTHYHISFDLSPLAKTVASIAMLIVFSVGVITDHQDYRRTRRVEIRETEVRYEY